VLDDMLRCSAAARCSTGSARSSRCSVERSADRELDLARARSSAPRAPAIAAHLHPEARAHPADRRQTFKIAGPNDPTGATAGRSALDRQHVFDGATFRQREIPPRKRCSGRTTSRATTHWGVPPTRHCYKAWTFKQQIEKLNLLHIDKFGVGTPVAEEGEGWQQADRDRSRPTSRRGDRAIGTTSCTRTAVRSRSSATKASRR
jgi:hypothetical protein